MEDRTLHEGEISKELSGVDEAPFHVEQGEDSSWVVWRKGSDLPETVFASKQDALDQAEIWAEEAGTSVLVNGNAGENQPE
ncbi:DUF2188 domain-containing protein [Planomicrobium sp. YIM 101495]|uniref:DUF2188 domain-containing protein n=1 Tax=Planomicrobium sp. YIM 101495 TaxID=2665160 RepID=UPI0018AC2573|nr:DUF2188 domain-containing protein [Planomicrobium sp. YIM 101495]